VPSKVKPNGASPLRDPPLSRKEDVEDKTREDWNATALGWRKWDPLIMAWLRPVGDKMLELAELGDEDSVLDVATGSGEPGLSAARRLKHGRVVGIDISREMVNTARGKAKKLGLANYEASVYSGPEFPFENESFDAVTCRFGIMFFPEPMDGLIQMARVLKPEAKACVAVWGPQNPTTKAILDILNERLGIPETRLDSPNALRCSQSGKIESLLTGAGFSKVGRAEVSVRRVHDSARQYWDYLMEVNTQYAAAFGKAKKETRVEVERGVNDLLADATTDQNKIVLPSTAWVGYGTR
jgi:SAM-dependent methyltransferase